jgi:DNA processing protein
VDLGLDAASKKFWVGFSRIKGIGAVRTKHLLEYFGDLSVAWNASEQQLRQAGLGAKITQNLLEIRKTLDLDREIEQIRQSGIKIVTIEETDYPKKLLSIEFPPPVLYLKGTITDQDECAVAIVGTRNLTLMGDKSPVNWAIIWHRIR